MDKKKIAYLLKELRKEKNISQDELAVLVGVSREAVSKWETGKACPDLAILESLSTIFNISILELIYGEKINNLDYKIVYKPFKDRLKYKIKYIVSICLLLVSLIIFLLYYFINTYNSINIYTLNYKNDFIRIENGLVITTKKETYFYLGKVTSPENIESIKLYYHDKNRNYHEVIYTKELTIFLADYSARNSYFDVNDIDYILNNLFLQVTSENRNENYHLNYEKKFANKFFFSSKKVLNYIERLLPPENIVMNKINAFTCEKKDCVLSIGENERFIYEKESYIIKLEKSKNNNRDIWIYDYENDIITFQNFELEEIIDDYSLVNNILYCKVGRCQNYQEQKKYFEDMFDYYFR